MSWTLVYHLNLQAPSIGASILQTSAWFSRMSADGTFISEAKVDGLLMRRLTCNFSSLMSSDDGAYMAFLDDLKSKNGTITASFVVRPRCGSSSLLLTLNRCRMQPFDVLRRRLITTYLDRVLHFGLRLITILQTDVQSGNLHVS